jgi:hypothetical protein
MPVSVPEHVPFPALGLKGALVGQVLGVAIDHGAGFLSVEAHQVAFGAAGGEPAVAEGVPELVRSHLRISGLGGAADEHLADAGGA